MARRRTPAAVAEEHDRQGDPVQPQSLRSAGPLRWRRLPRHRQQCRRKTSEDHRRHKQEWKNYLFLGSDEGGRRAARIYTSVEAARPNELNSHASFRRHHRSFADAWIVAGVRRARARMRPQPHRTHFAPNMLGCGESSQRRRWQPFSMQKSTNPPTGWPAAAWRCSDFLDERT